MRILLFGATGMIGQGVLRECLLDPGVVGITSVVRRASGVTDAKFRELVHDDFTDFSKVEDQLAGHDACFFCLGVSSTGMSEPAYRRITHDFALAPAQVLARRSPGSTFVFVSGRGTDASSRIMWSKVKGQTENELLALTLRTYVFRPALVQPLHGITSRTPSYRVLYALFRPVVPLLKAVFPNEVTTTERVGRAMLAVSRSRPEKRILESADINAAGQA